MNQEEPYEQCTPEQGVDAMRKVGPIFQSFLAGIPDGEESMYVSTLATLAIVNMICNGSQEAVKLFLERSIADIPKLARIAQEAKRASTH